MPYVWHYRRRVVIALILLVAAKLANIGVPVILKHLVDGLDLRLTVLTIPALLLIAYGALRLSTSLFQELRQVVFARVLARTSREVTLRVFSHLHALSLLPSRPPYRRRGARCRTRHGVDHRSA